MKIRSRNQGGSIASFAAVSVLLAIVLIGGLYVVQRYATNQATSSEVATDSQSDDENNTSDGPSGDDSTTTTDTSGNNDNTTTDGSDNSETTTSELPKTGPADVALKALAVSLLVFASVAYAQSRRASLDL